jgi:hypothetical protein
MAKVADEAQSTGTILAVFRCSAPPSLCLIVFYRRFAALRLLTQLIMHLP